MPDNKQGDKSKGAGKGGKIDDLANRGKNLGGKESENVKGGRMAAEPEVTKNDTSDMYK